MKKLLTLLFLILALSACSAKTTPSWIAAGHKQLEAFKQNFLAGGTPRITENHFRDALEEIKKGGDVDLLGKAWLTRMALQVAVIKAPEEVDYLKIESVQTVSANHNYYLFLTGNADGFDVTLLPEPYRPFWAGLRDRDAAKATAAVAAIDDPLSRLIASGLAVRNGLETEALLRTAVETASQNGWKMALLAWLERLKGFYEAAGDTQKASAIRSRIDLILSI